jgi:hypothetical protein
MTVGHAYLEERLRNKTLKWNYSIEASVSKWLCPTCGDTHCPSTDLKNRILAMFGLTESSQPTCVVARVGDFNLNQKVNYKNHSNINAEVLINILRMATMLQELDGRTIEDTTILEAVGALHEKAQVFFNAHFKDKTVIFKACDFRLGKTDRSGRVALCEDRRLSLQHVGQDVPALLLDMDECPPLERDELIDILVTISSFYDTRIVDPTKAQKSILYMLEQEGAQRRQQVTQNMDHVALQMGRLSV